MKRLLATVLCLLMLAGIPALAAEPAVVTVTLADQGSLVAVSVAVEVTDADGDEALTINDALILLHDAKGAEYATAETEWGLSITKLWGDTSGNFGYWLNNASAWSLTDPVKDGDFLYAFIYQDGETFSDQYCYFDETAVSAKAGEEITLTLTGMVYDAVSWGYAPAPVEGAIITVDGEKTAFKTDAEGKVTLKIEEAGEHLISAVSESGVLVPPICRGTVTAVQQEGSALGNTGASDEPQKAPIEDDGDTTDNPPTGDSSMLLLFAALLVVSGGALALLFAKKKFFYEK